MNIPLFPQLQSAPAVVLAIVHGFVNLVRFGN